jgi:hypothetical protein
VWHGAGVIVREPRRGRLLAGVLSGVLLTVLIACTPSDPAPPPAPPAVVGQPVPSEVRDLTPFVKFPCNLVPPAVVQEFGLGEIRVSEANPAMPQEPAGCRAEVAKGPPGSGGSEDDVLIVPFVRDVVAEEEASPLRLEPSPPVAGLPAGVRPALGRDDCDLLVRTAPDQGLRVELSRYREKPEASCDLARRIAGSVLAWVPRASG